MKKFKDLKYNSKVYEVNNHGEIDNESIRSISSNTILLSDNTKIHPNLNESSCKSDYSYNYFTEMSEARKCAIELLRKIRKAKHEDIIIALQEIESLSLEIEQLK